MYALFFQTTRNTVGLVRQFLIVPSEFSNGLGHHAVTVYTRSTAKDGSRGRAAAWSIASTDPTSEVSPLSTVLRHPSAVKVTESDRRQMLEKGIPTTLAAKGQTANDRPAAPQFAEPQAADAYFATAINLVSQQGAELAGFFHDGRAGRTVRKQPPAPTQTPAPAPVTSPVTVIPATSQDVSPDPMPRATTQSRMALIPATGLASQYVHRKVYGSDDFAVFDRALAEQENILVYGPTGAGKTMGALAFAAERGMPTFTISGSVNFDPAQAFGRERIRNGEVIWADGGATEIARHGGLLILDEINFIPSKVMTPLFPMLDDRRQITLLDNDGETIPCHPNTLIVATMNRGYAGTQVLNFALANRFKYHLSWGYDEEVEKKLVPLKSVREFAQKLRIAEGLGSIQTPTPTNAVVDFVNLAQDLGLDFAIDNFKARYEDSEQSAIRLALDATRANIEADLGLAPEPTTEPAPTYDPNANPFA